MRSYLSLSLQRALIHRPLPFSCANFTEAYWTEFHFNVDTPEDVVSIVNRLWGLDEDSFGLFEVNVFENRWGNPSEVSWGRIAINGPIGIYSAWIQNGTLQKIDVQWISPLPQPTLSQAIACLGKPEYYIAYYAEAVHDFGTNLDLLYLEKGFVIRYESPYTSYDLPEPITEFHPYMRIRELAVVAPGTLEQVVRAVYSNGNVGGGYSCLSEPWPGSIEAMEIVPLDDFFYCQSRRGIRVIRYFVREISARRGCASRRPAAAPPPTPSSPTTRKSNQRPYHRRQLLHLRQHRLALKRGNTLYHLHGDHLGSTSLTTRGSAETASRADYAYGAERSASGDFKTDHTFTGQKSFASGLLYDNTRYDDPALGAFISPSTVSTGALANGSTARAERTHPARALSLQEPLQALLQGFRLTALQPVAARLLRSASRRTIHERSDAPTPATSRLAPPPPRAYRPPPSSPFSSGHAPRHAHPSRMAGKARPQRGRLAAAQASVRQHPALVFAPILPLRLALA